MPTDEMYDGFLIYSTHKLGAVFIDGNWFPFQFFDSGNIDVLDDAYNTKEAAFEHAVNYFT